MEIDKLKAELDEALGRERLGHDMYTRMKKERDELAKAFREIYDSLIDSGLPVIASSTLHALRERLDKEASGE